MEIEQFKKLIKNLPYKNQSFDIKKENWENTNQESLINNIFDGKNVITLNRFDLFNSTFNIEEYIIKTLMWGYPTKGRGNNIDAVLEKVNFENLKNLLLKYQESNVSFEKLKADFKNISGIGISTISKLLYFLNIYIDGKKCLILDLRVINALRKETFSELKILKNISYVNALNKYSLYLENLNLLSKNLDVEADQIELFIFMFGNNLTELKGEECYDDIDSL